jgi:GT2 family glycosyltransferase
LSSTTIRRAARGRWLALVDDDASVDEGWLAAWWRCIEERDADGYLGPVLARSGAADVPALGAHLRNGLLRIPLPRDGAFDAGLRSPADAEDALVRALSARGARFAWCDGAVVRGSLRPGPPDGRGGRAGRPSSRRRGRLAA